MTRMSAYFIIIREIVEVKFYIRTDSHVNKKYVNILSGIALDISCVNHH